MEDITPNGNWKSFREYPGYYSELFRLIERIRAAKTPQEKKALLENVYVLLKCANADLHGNFLGNHGYRGLLDRAKLGEVRVGNLFVMDTKPDFDYDNDFFFDNSFKDLDTNEEILDYVIWLTRRDIVDRMQDYYPDKVSLDEFHLTDECRYTSEYFKRLCDSLGIRCRVIRINPGYGDQDELYDGNGFHYFNLVEIGDVPYLVDCTYRQFFRMGNNLIERLGVTWLNGCNLGAFMVMDEERKQVASHLLKKGWIVASKENVKKYLDGFTFSFRNGLYYERHNCDTFEIPYDISDYKSFFEGKDSQIREEGSECLGIQKEPLKDFRLEFKRFKK